MSVRSTKIERILHPRLAGDFQSDEAVAERLCVLLSAMRAEQNEEAVRERNDRISRGESPFPLVTFRDISFPTTKEIGNSDLLLERIEEIGLWLGAARMDSVCKRVDVKAGLTLVAVLDHAWDGINGWVA